MRYLSGVNRTICSVIDAIRKCHETHNYSMLMALVEEIQILAEAMEAHLWDQNSIKEYKEVIKKLKEELTALDAEIKAKEKLKELI